MDDPNSLTGVWDGLFSYPRLYKPTTFTAVLFETGSALSGTIYEVSSHAVSAGQTLQASVEGVRSGADVRFTKIYEPDSRRNRAPVDYVGLVNADATEIDGTWTVRGNWSGKFLMIRSGRQQQAEERRAQQSVPVS